MIRLGDTKRETFAPFGKVVDPLRLLLLRAVADHEQQAHVVPHDGMLVLQVVVQAQALYRQVLADDRHIQVGTVLATELFRLRVAVVPGFVGQPLRLEQELLPLLVRQPAPLPVRAGVFAAVVEEADVVVLLLQRLDGAFDEVVQLVQVAGQFFRYLKVHVSCPPR